MSNRKFSKRVQQVVSSLCYGQMAAMQQIDKYLNALKNLEQLRCSSKGKLFVYSRIKKEWKKLKKELKKIQKTYDALPWLEP